MSQSFMVVRRFDGWSSSFGLGGKLQAHEMDRQHGHTTKLRRKPVIFLAVPSVLQSCAAIHPNEGYPNQGQQVTKNPSRLHRLYTPWSSWVHLKVRTVSLSEVGSIIQKRRWDETLQNISPCTSAGTEILSAQTIYQINYALKNSTTTASILFPLPLGYRVLVILLRSWWDQPERPYASQGTNGEG